MECAQRTALIRPTHQGRIRGLAVPAQHKVPLSDPSVRPILADFGCGFLRIFCPSAQSRARAASDWLTASGLLDEIRSSFLTDEDLRAEPRASTQSLHVHYKRVMRRCSCAHPRRKADCDLAKFVRDSSKVQAPRAGRARAFVERRDLDNAVLPDPFFVKRKRRKKTPTRESRRLLARRNRDGIEGPPQHRGYLGSRVAPCLMAGDVGCLSFTNYPTTDWPWGSA